MLTLLLGTSNIVFSDLGKRIRLHVHRQLQLLGYLPAYGHLFLLDTQKFSPL